MIKLKFAIGEHVVYKGISRDGLKKGSELVINSYNGKDYVTQDKFNQTWVLKEKELKQKAKVLRKYK